MLIIYTGNGKGKTSASVGQAVRAMGQGLKVAFAQFMKSDVRAGEQVMLAPLLGENFLIGGCGFFRSEAERETHRAAALDVLAWSHKKLAETDMLVLDEALYALNAGLILEDELRGLVQESRAQGNHLVLSGRGAPEWLVEEADTLTEMLPVKHHYAASIKAQKGIEF